MSNDSGDDYTDDYTDGDETATKGSKGSKASKAGDNREWIPDEALKGLNMEREFHTSESEVELAERMLKENLPAAVASIAHTAIYGSNERLRVDASKYLIDRVLGKIQDGKDGGNDPLLDFMERFTKQTEEHANTGPSNGHGKP